MCEAAAAPAMRPLGTIIGCTWYLAMHVPILLPAQLGLVLNRSVIAKSVPYEIPDRHNVRPYVHECSGKSWGELLTDVTKTDRVH